VLFSDPATGLVIECEVTHYPQAAAVEWVCWLHNTGDAPTPLIDSFMPLDGMLLRHIDGAPVQLRWSQGDGCTEASFLPHDELLNPKVPRRFLGYSSDTHYLPFFNVAAGEEGWMVAVGWTGHWMAEFVHDERSNLRLRVGMPETSFRLQPGERVRGPRIGLLRYDGPLIRGHNLLRRFMLQHIVPRADGSPIVPPVAINHVAALWLHAHRNQQPLGALTEQTELALIEKAAALSCEAYWMDAYWFPQPWWEGNMGNWWPREDDFPRGLRPLSDAAHRRGMQFVLWFAPLHVHAETRWARQLPAFVHPASEGTVSSVGAGVWKLYDPAAREFLVDWLSQRVDEWGIDVYREDFGTPLPPDEGPERVGVAEMKQVEGFYKFWSE
jgi:alpha-galactosidase